MVRLISRSGRPILAATAPRGAKQMVLTGLSRPARGLEQLAVAVPLLQPRDPRCQPTGVHHRCAEPDAEQRDLLSRACRL
jgi:hypothetical protein